MTEHPGNIPEAPSMFSFDSQKRADASGKADFDTTVHV